MTKASVLGGQIVITVVCTLRTMKSVGTKNAVIFLQVSLLENKN